MDKKTIKELLNLYNTWAKGDPHDRDTWAEEAEKNAVRRFINWIERNCKT